MRISDWSSDVFSSDLKNSGPMHHPVNVLGLFHKVLNNSLIVSMLTKKSRHSNKCVLEQPGTKRKFLFIRIGCPASLIEQLFNRSEERRVGKECVRTCRSGGARVH